MIFHEARLGHDQRAFVLQSDALLPAQFYETMQRSLYLQPDKQLMLAVLDNALQCLQKHLLARSRKGRRLFRETEEWVLARDSDWIFSFENICEFLTLDPEYLRKRVRLWKEKQLAQWQGSQPQPSPTPGKKACKKSLRAAA
jgi:hypothetical protein